MAQKNQDLANQLVFTPRNSLQQSKITPSMTKNSLQSCKASDTGHTCSKELKPLSWYLQITPTSATTEIQGKLDHVSLDISQKESNTTYSWSTNLELQTAQMPYPADLIMKATTQTMKTSLYGQSNISVNSTQTFTSSTLTV